MTSKMIDKKPDLSIWLITLVIAFAAFLPFLCLMAYSILTGAV